MLKQFPWKTVLLTLLAWMLFWEVKETISGERPLFIYRWLYSDKGHAKNIEVLTYLLTDEQVAYMLVHPDEIVQQPNKKELRLQNVNVVLRIRNLTGGVASGKLSWTMPGMARSEVDINDIPNPSDSRRYANTVIPLGIVIGERGDVPPYPISTSWKELYVYR